MSGQSDFDAIIAALVERVDDLAPQVYDPFATQIPDARQWDSDRREKFVAQARGRFGAILAVLGHGPDVAEALQNDLSTVGANAAINGSSLPHLLLVLRISRDLLLREAMRVANDVAAAEFAQCLLPAVDRLTDALARGFWGFTIDQLDGERNQFAAILDEVPCGIYETDMDGVVVYTNSVLLRMLGVNDEDVLGSALSDVLRAVGSPTVGALFSELAGRPPVELNVMRLDETPIRVRVQTVIRRDDDGKLAGFSGIVQAL